MNKAFSKEMFLDLMDEVEAFGVPMPRESFTGEKIVVLFSDGFFLFEQSHWQEILDLWDIESLPSIYYIEIESQ